MSAAKPRRNLWDGWFICLVIGIISSCACALFFTVGLAKLGDRFNGSWYSVGAMVTSQPAWIGLALAAYLFARKLSREGAGALGVGGRVFAGLFAITALAAGGFLLWEGYANPGLGEPETISKMQKFGLGAVVAGLLGIGYCVFAGRNPEAPELDLD